MAKKLIPRRLIYCWFGNNEKPPMVQKCIASWKEHNPTWEIVEINENNFPIDEYPFVQEALKRKKYAFATDVARLWGLLNMGGVYCDSDFFCVRPLDRFLETRAFTGHETKDLMVTAIMGSVKGHEWIKLLLDYYKDRPYGENTNTNIITQLSKPLVIRENEYGFRWLKGDVTIYPVSYFCSFQHQKLEIIPHKDAYGYHLFLGSWTGRQVRDVEIPKVK
ncbi:glycosyltransferase family 32 protein [Paenibacillus tianjinensis]|uniref:Glycosyltransferase sugar-binding region containing DXD motif-containing protein n=1 Tax=Paenibacillus tianjinensis TaxID=2810347 RepID=A0ABX7L870_9BACL|nr:capsular polysaccharide synthesis protein [Paenibacillus tianjinensis]QSF43541.1 hypothetical protein JRJ22_19975 [Paenibacillus tianjinensis]